MRSLSRALGAGFAWLLVFGHGAFALDQIPAAPDKPNPPPADAESHALWSFFSAKTPYEFWLTCAILGAGLAFAYLAITFLRQIRGPQLELATRAMTILFVIIATMVLITAGYNNEQIAPAFGLFGTIVGYILGRGAQQPVLGAQDGGEDAAAPVPAEDANKTAVSRNKSSKRGTE